MLDNIFVIALNLIIVFFKNDKDSKVLLFFFKEVMSLS